MLQAAEQAETPGVRRQLFRLRMRLEIGIPVARALDEAVPALPRRTLGLIDAADRVGRLGPALARLATRRELAPRRDPSSGIFLRWYSLVLWVFVIGATSTLAVLVIPRYVQITRGFDLPVPAASRWVLAWGDEVLPIAASLTLPLLLVYVGRMTAAVLAPRLQRPAVLTSAGDRLLWHLPLARSVTRARGFADVCNVLADALEAGSSPVGALTDASALKTNGVLLRRVRRWAERADAGLPLADAARAARMPKLMVGLLATTTVGGDAPRVLRFLARYYESRFSRAAELLRSAAAPLLALVFGALVLVVALAVMTPLVDLADGISSKMNGGPL
jgi:type II secretory pathway component PulF